MTRPGGRGSTSAALPSSSEMLLAAWKSSSVRAAMRDGASSLSSSLTSPVRKGESLRHSRRAGGGCPALTEGSPRPAVPSSAASRGPAMAGAAPQRPSHAASRREGTCSGRCACAPPAPRSTPDPAQRPRQTRLAAQRYRPPPHPERQAPGPIGRRAEKAPLLAVR